MAAGTASPGGMTVEAFKGSFFDGDKVLKAMDRATRRVFSRFGAFVRRRAQTSIRYRVQASPPGQPPSAHKSAMRTKTNKRTGVTGQQAASPLRDMIYFAYAEQTQSVIVGPALFGGTRQTRSGPQTIPETLEKGGTSTITEALSGGQWRLLYSLDLAQRTTKPTRRRAARIAARSFMAPALEAELPNLTRMYEHSF
jgi:hypothetical protein